MRKIDCYTKYYLSFKQINKETHISICVNTHTHIHMYVNIIIDMY